MQARSHTSIAVTALDTGMRVLQETKVWLCEKRKGRKVSRRLSHVRRPGPSRMHGTEGTRREVCAKHSGVGTKMQKIREKVVLPSGRNGLRLEIVLMQSFLA